MSDIRTETIRWKRGGADPMGGMSGGEMDGGRL